jgi:hypothetical protein
MGDKNPRQVNLGIKVPINFPHPQESLAMVGEEKGEGDYTHSTR